MGKTEVTWNEFQLFMYPEEDKKIREGKQFTPEQARAYDFALLEVCFRSADLPRALTVSQRINPAALFPLQRKRFEEVRQHLMLHTSASPSS